MAELATRTDRRRLLIRLAEKRQRPGSGSGIGFLRERTADFRFPDLVPILSPLKWAVVGAAATRHYMPERATKDLDILIAVQDAGAAGERLRNAGAARQGDLSIGGSRWTLADGFQVDVLELTEPWVKVAIDAAQTNRDPQGLPVIPLAHLVLMKFRSSRVQDIADISRMLGGADDTLLENVRTLFRELQPLDLDDLESLITLGKLEYQEE